MKVIWTEDNTSAIPLQNIVRFDVISNKKEQEYTLYAILEKYQMQALLTTDSLEKCQEYIEQL